MEREYNSEQLSQVREEGYLHYLEDNSNVNNNPYNNDEEWPLHEAWKDGYYDAAWDS